MTDYAQDVGTLRDFFMPKGNEAFKEFEDFRGAADQQSAVDSADAVLVMLSKGVLQGETLDCLQCALRADAQSSNKWSRLVLVYQLHSNSSTAAYGSENGWDYSGSELNSAPAEVQAAIRDTEAIPFRPKASKRFEFLAMANEIARRLHDRSEREKESD